MGAVGGLGFYRWIPPGVEHEYVVGRGQIQTVAAGLETD